MKITILDTNTLSTGDLPLCGFSALGETVFFDQLTTDEVIEKCKDSEIIVCNKTPFNAETLSKLPQLRLICVAATGYNNIDTNAAKSRGIAVCNAPGYSSESVVQTVFSLLLNLAGSTYKYIDSVQKGDWVRSRVFSYFPYPICELSGKTLGIVGYGSIGRRVAAVGESFGMNIIINSRTEKADCPYRQMSLESMLPLCDFLSLNCPLTPKTAHIINSETLKLMKKTAFIINTSRGGTVDEAAVANAVKLGLLAGFGADVIDKEPMSENCPLIGVPGIIITPHIAWATKEARERLIEICINNIKGYIDGKPVNTVNL